MRPLIRFSDVRLAGVAFSKRQAIGGTGKRTEGVKRGAQGLRGLVRRCCFLPFFGVLAACSTLGDTLETTPFLREQITGDTWRACLAREYQSQARLQVRPGRHWAKATHLAAKGRAALLGKDVTPEATHPALTAELEAVARARAARDANPCGCATVQARYDGWRIALEQDPARDQSRFRSSFAEAVTTCDKVR